MTGRKTPASTRKAVSKNKTPEATTVLTAAPFIKRLHALESPQEQLKIQWYFKSGEGQYGHGDQFIGVRMAKLFELAKEFADLPIQEIERLLEARSMKQGWEP